ncbi:MAG TPA: hypothetical protein ENO14_00865 [Chromatiales bacterium]|nr:hypothetical protein [Chromatiales bacterium]
MKNVFLAASFAVLLAACDFSEMTVPAATSECRQIGARCQLSDGPLGVCIETRCENEQTPPCFACTPQH